MNTKFNETIVETNGVRTVAGGGTGTTTLSSLRDSLEVLSLSGGVISANTTTDTLRITQTGLGNALVVEDMTNPDGTPFLIDTNGTIVIGASAASSKTLSRKGVQFVTSTTLPSRIVELRSHNTSGIGGNTQVDFVRTRTGSPNDYSTTPLSAYDIIGEIAFKGGNSITGTYITCQNKNDSSIGSISGSRLLFETHVASTSLTYTALTLDEDKAGIGTLTPNEALTVVGNISATQTIYASGGNSDQWNAVYSSTKNTSANWDSAYSSVKATSANWDSVYSNVQSGSANWSNMLPTSGGTVSGNITINGTITAPNASSVLGDQVANVGTLDTRYYNAIVPQLTERQYFDTVGKWVQVAEFPAAGQRHHIEFTAFVTSDFNASASFKLLFIIDGYDNSGTSNNFFPVSQIATNYGMLSAVRMRTPNNSGPKSMFLDLNLVPSASGTQSSIDSYVKIYSRNVTYTQVTPNLSAIVDPVITSQILGPEFLPGSGALFKDTTGDYSSCREGQTIINNADNNIKIFAEGAWRQIASW